ncbi:MAG: hypothetical protein ABIN97_05240 [Ginsengibacter sp.]
MNKFLIVSADDIILYQPTILNLYDLLNESFDVTIISFQPEYLGKLKETSRKVVYISIPKNKKFFFKNIDLFFNAIFKRINKYAFNFNYRFQFLRKLKCNLLIKELKKYEKQQILAVDVMPLYATQKIFDKCHFLSLEILMHDKYLKKIDTNRILSVIIQNTDRYNYLFAGNKLKTFYIQNSPSYENICINKDKRNDLVWGGSIVENFGVINCIEFVKKYPDYKLLLKGAAEPKTLKIIKTHYYDLLEAGRVIINSDYLSVKDFIAFLSNFKIGFCFYNWELIKKNFNYQSAPSGKVFMYLAAGVPVIACNIPGFKFIEEYKAGVLINDYSPKSIYKAVIQIEKSYSFFQQNCYRAFEKMSFEKEAIKFKNYLLANF